MRKSLLAISLCYLLLSCANSDTSTGVEVNKDVTRTQTKTLGERITGAWTYVGDQNVTFVIQKDKVFYPETSIAYDYQLTNEYIKINYDGYVGTYQVEMKGEDTLVLKDDDEEQIYLQVK